MRTLIFASNNQFKAKELINIVRELGYGDDIEIKTLKDLNIQIDVEETFDTLEENALKKARETYKEISDVMANPIVIAEDFGFFIEELPEVAGVKSNRWYEGTDEDRNDEVLKRMKNIKNRKCYYKSTFAIYDGEIERVFSGYTYGVVANEKKGTNGFAYDSIFELEGGMTIAELEPEEKDEISSRTEAFEYLIKSL